MLIVRGIQGNPGELYDKHCQTIISIMQLQMLDVNNTVLDKLHSNVAKC